MHILYILVKCLVCHGMTDVHPSDISQITDLGCQRQHQIPKFECQIPSFQQNTNIVPRAASFALNSHPSSNPCTNSSSNRNFSGANDPPPYPHVMHNNILNAERAVNMILCLSKVKSIISVGSYWHVTSQLACQRPTAAKARTQQMMQALRHRSSSRF